MNIKELLPEAVLPVFLKYRVQEIRFIAEKPVGVCINGKMLFVSEAGDICTDLTAALICDREMISRVFKKACNNSVYAYGEDIKRGFVTIDGGHRIGICGSGVIKDGGLTYIKDISALNIRIAYECTGCSKKVMDFVLDGGLSNTLIISPPGCGKTTLLRDMARELGNVYKLGIADERNEIFTDSFDVGRFTAVMSAVPKAVSVNMMIRSMGLDAIVTDEIGSEADAREIENAIYSGVCVIASIHGKSVGDIKAKNSRIYACFDKAIVLSRRYGVGTVEEMVRCL